MDQQQQPPTLQAKQEVFDLQQQITQFITKFSYLSEKGRINLNKYQYKGSDASVFSKLLTPFWESCVKLIPVNMAPNMVTFLGFIGVIVAFTLMITFNPKLDSDVPRWVSLFCAIMLFYYQTMDAIDGKHARNTKNGSVLGELFDHGVDALVTSMQSIIAIGALQLGNSFWSYTCMFLVYLTAYLIIWEAYVTDELRFGLLNGATEAVLFVIGILVLNAGFGSTLWKGISVAGFTLNKIVILLFILADTTTLYQTIVEVSQKIEQRSAITGGFRGVIQALAPFLVTLILYSAYAISQPNMLYNYTVSFLLNFGLLLSYLQTRLIFAKACQERVATLFLILAPLPFITLNACTHGYAVPLIHYLYMIYTIACYSHFVYHAISEVCLVLGIEALSVGKHPPVMDGYDAVTIKSGKA